MAILTKDQIEKLAGIIRKHASWAVKKLLGTRYVTSEEIERLKADGLLPKEIKTSSIKEAFVLGKMESVLKEAEWKNLTWDQVKEVALEKQTPLQRMQIESAEMSMNVTLRGLFNDVQNGLFEGLSVANGAAANAAIVKDKVAEEIKSGVESRKNYIQVANGLIDSLGETKRNWHRVAVNELHAAREKGVVGSILSGEDVYRRADGVNSDVAIVFDPDCCEDCKRMYSDPSGKPKIFKLEEIMANEGSNYVRPWRKNARPVTPPLHPGCYCRIRYVPPGWGWNDKGRFTVTDSDKYTSHLQSKVDKSLDILRKSGDHSLLNESLQDIPTEDQIRSIQDLEELIQMISKLKSLKDLATDDPNTYYHLEDLEHLAVAHSVSLKQGEGDVQ